MLSGFGGVGRVRVLGTRRMRELRSPAKHHKSAVTAAAAGRPHRPGPPCSQRPKAERVRWVPCQVV